MKHCTICGCILDKYVNGPICDVCQDELTLEDTDEEVANECD